MDRTGGNPSNPNLNPHPRASLGRDPQENKCAQTCLTFPHPRFHLGAIHKNKSVGELQTGINKGKGTMCPTGENTPEYREECEHIIDMSLKNKCVADMRSGPCHVSQNLT